MLIVTTSYSLPGVQGICSHGLDLPLRISVHSIGQL